MKVTGKITGISEVQTFDSGSKKVSFQIDTEEQYNNVLSFDFFKNSEHSAHIDNFPKYNKVGDIVEVDFNIICKEYNDKYYTDLSAWKVMKLEQQKTDDLAF